MVTATRNGAHAEAGIKTRVVALVGTASSSRDLVNEQESDGEVWGLNTSYDWMPRYSRWFEMHDRTRYDHIKDVHLERLQSMECPVYMTQHYEDIPKSVRYPVEFVTQNGRFRPLLTSSVAYMLALAVAEGFHEIRLCGIDMAMDSEYAYQRSACEYWIGVAEASGIKVVIPASSPIGKAPLYGQEPMLMERSLSDWKDRVGAEKVAKYEGFITDLYNKLDEFRINSAAHEGALQVLAKMQRQDGA